MKKFNRWAPLVGMLYFVVVAAVRIAGYHDAAASIEAVGGIAGIGGLVPPDVVNALGDIVAGLAGAYGLFRKLVLPHLRKVIAALRKPASEEPTA